MPPRSWGNRKITVANNSITATRVNAAITANMIFVFSMFAAASLLELRNPSAPATNSSNRAPAPRNHDTAPTPDSPSNTPSNSRPARPTTTTASA
ncbi:hypothetical protein HX744_26765 [Pseudonocardia sp. ICBG1122]|nr:hypothetical protein [Pseudonocardia pini]